MIYMEPTGRLHRLLLMVSPDNTGGQSSSLPFPEKILNTRIADDFRVVNPYIMT